MKPSFIPSATASLLLVMTMSSTVHAQTGLQATPYGIAGATFLAAADSFDAVAGTNVTPSVGGGVAVTLNGAFVDVAVSYLKIDGERVFVDEGIVYTLNIPLRVTMIPVDIAVGWRRTGKLSPFVAAGLSWISYRERSGFAASGDDVDDSGVGLLALAGMDLRVAPRLRIGGEVRYRKVDALDENGAASVFGERSMGGLATSVRVSIGR